MANEEQKSEPVSESKEIIVEKITETPEGVIESQNEIVEKQTKELDSIIGDEGNKINIEGSKQDIQKFEGEAKEIKTEADETKEEYYEELRSNITNLDDQAEYQKKKNIEINAETIIAEKSRSEKIKVENSTEVNVEKTKEFSVREFIQSYYDDFSAEIKKIVESNQNYSEKFDAIDELSNELQEQIGFIREDILKTNEAKEILGSLKGEFSKAKKDIKESISEKGLRKEASNSIQNSAKIVENGLKGLELSKENASGKISAVKGISSFFELTVKIYENIIDNDETLRSIVNDKREMIKTAMRKLEKEQAIKDAEAEKKGLS